jgi:hypothetical protein
VATTRVGTPALEVALLCSTGSTSFRDYHLPRLVNLPVDLRNIWGEQTSNMSGRDRSPDREGTRALVCYNFPNPIAKNMVLFTLSVKPVFLASGFFFFFWIVLCDSIAFLIVVGVFFF